MAEKGALEGAPDPEIEGYPVLECSDCYTKRVGTNLTWGEVKARFIAYNKKPERIGSSSGKTFYHTSPVQKLKVQKLKHQSRS